MASQITATKGNLMSTKKTLALAKMGYELLDKKRNILIREMMTLIDRANEIQGKIDNAYSAAYFALQRANILSGFCDEISQTIPIERRLKLSYRSVMGVEIPIVSMQGDMTPELHYGLFRTNSPLDDAYIKFNEVKV